MEDYYKKLLKRFGYVVLGASVFYGVCTYFEVPKFAYREREDICEKADTLNGLEKILETVDVLFDFIEEKDSLKR